LALLASSAGAAQHPQTRDGFWIGLGGGWGDAVLSCSPNCFFDRSAKGGGVTGFVKLGATVRPDVLLGVELNAWVKDVSGSTESGGTALRGGSIALAARQFARADSLCPGFHGAQVGSGFTLLRAGDPREAAQRFKRAVQSDSSDADAWYGLGLAWARLGERAP